MRRLFALIWKAVLENKGLVAAIIILGIVQAVCIKAPIALIQPLLEAFTQGSATPTDGEALQRIADAMVGFFGWDFDPAMNMLVACGIVFVILIPPGALSIYGILLLTRYFATKMIVSLRNDVAAQILRLPLRFFGRRKMGQLISNITFDTGLLSRAFMLACDHVVVDPLLILGNIVLLIVFVPEAVPILLVMIPAMAIPMYRLGRRVRKTSSSSLAAMGDATESMNQMLSGIRTVKAFQLEKQRLADFHESNAHYLDRTRRMLKAKATSQATVYAAYQFGFVALLLLLGWIVVVQGRYELSVIAVGAAAIATTYNHVKRLTRAYNMLLESSGALEGIQSLLLEDHDAGIDGRGEPVPTLDGSVELNQVSFAYGDGPVLQDVSLAVEPGQVVALVGHSGAGKSTTLDLLARFHDPTKGSILIDGKDLRDLKLNDYRKHIAIVSQQPFLFNASIRDNILCGRPDASQAEIEEAARSAQIHDFILGLPEGYDTQAGERGCNLSGGEMQRLTIARAILRDPRILILDEATSSLDSENERLVQKALQNLMVGRTSFIIAHRLSTITGADVIVVLDKGRIVEKGRHEELIERGGHYRRMRDLQVTS